MLMKKYVDAVISACGAQAHYDGALVILHTASFLDIGTPEAAGTASFPDTVTITPTAGIVACSPSCLMTGIASCLAIWDPGWADPRRYDDELFGHRCRLQSARGPPAQCPADAST